ncbi:hypothetical protein [Sutcliffiella rhizosphaerae]|uniref:Lipoprotein n=1 Tax=Sutcliffiella rhizosphaerae TaxID=2880967 RepID=A0ABN8AEZ9_9BACI|nr:hypothetical protein [Sutcliffiella rhizosphaerae]CAG9621415.1 hypothetical protein BACCIP111883_02188 [Sutcliffiella rhizosphaerae]
MKFNLFCLFAILTLFLTACGDKVLVVRTPLEGDHYIRSNIDSLEWKHFSGMVASGSDINEEDFNQLKWTLEYYNKTSYIMVSNELFRFNQDGRMVYYTDWIEEDGQYKIEELGFPNYDTSGDIE